MKIRFVDTEGKMIAHIIADVAPLKGDHMVMDEIKYTITDRTWTEKGLDVTCIPSDELVGG